MVQPPASFELAPHSIISSAPGRSVGGIVRPRAFVVLSSLAARLLLQREGRRNQARPRNPLGPTSAPFLFVCHRERPGGVGTLLPRVYYPRRTTPGGVNRAFSGTQPLGGPLISLQRRHHLCLGLRRIAQRIRTALQAEKAAGWTIVEPNRHTRRIGLVA